MRYKELKEVETDVVQLQKQIQQRVAQTQDTTILNKVASLLRKSNIGNITKLAFSRDEDAKQFVDRLAQMIIELDVPISDKVQFLKEFGRKNYIKPGKLFDGSAQVRSMDDWWEGTGLASVFFQQMINDPLLQGKFAGSTGPGEVAIACFHKDITVGTTSTQDYDLMYDNKKIEVKAKTATSSGGGGRWTAYDNAPFETYLSQSDSLLNRDAIPLGVRTLPGTSRVKQPSLAQVLMDPQYAKNPKKPLTRPEQKKIFAKVLKIAYQSADNKVINNAVANYPNISPLDIGKVAFASYKIKQGLHSMLLIKKSDVGLNTISFVEPTDEMMTFISTGDTYVRGQKQRGMDFQATLK